MASEQPYMHNLSGVFSAPIQAWSDAHGQVRSSGAQGIYCGDDRVLNHAVLTVNGREPDWVSTQLRSSQETDYIYFVRADAEVADPLLSLVRTRTAESSRVRAGEDTETLTGCSGRVAETLRFESAHAAPGDPGRPADPGGGQHHHGAGQDRRPQRVSGGRRTPHLVLAGRGHALDPARSRTRQRSPASSGIPGSTVTIDWAVEVLPGVGRRTGLGRGPRRRRFAHARGQRGAHHRARFRTIRG